MAAPETPDPQGALAWANAILETLKAAYAAVLLPSALGLAWFVRTIHARQDRANERSDKRRADEDAARQRIEDELEGERAAEFKRLRDDLAEVRAELVTKNAEINRLTGLIRTWFGLAHDVWHDWAQQWQVASWMAERGGMTPLSDARNPRRLSRDIDSPGYEPRNSPEEPK